MRTAPEILQSLVADVKAMKESASAKNVFGPFRDGDMDREGYYIGWPNLEILITEADEFLKEEMKTNKQLWVNCEWLILQIDLIHEALCPNKLGTWQQRAEQAVKAAQKLSKTKR